LTPPASVIHDIVTIRESKSCLLLLLLLCKHPLHKNDGAEDNIPRIIICSIALAQTIHKQGIWYFADTVDREIFVIKNFSSTIFSDEIKIFCAR
jgi:hypothetical protein